MKSKGGEQSLEGSMSVFTALIILLLIAFMLSIYDYTRLHMIQLQALGNYHLASEYLLSQYDPVMFQEYGLLAGKSGAETEMAFDEYLSKSFYPDEAKKADYFMDYILEPQTTSRSVGFMEPESYTYDIDYIPFLDASFSNPKVAILDYMEPREKYLFARNWLDDFDFFSKTTKTGTVLQEKNDLVRGLDSLESFKRQLYQLIDGITVHENGEWEFNTSAAYVRKISAVDGVNYDYFPENLRVLMMNNVLFLRREFKYFREDMDNIEGYMDQLFRDDAFEVIEMDGEDGEVVYFYAPQPIIQEAITDLEVIDAYFSEYVDALDDVLALKQVHIDILDVIHNYEQVTLEHIYEIDNFLMKTGSNEDLMRSAVLSVESDLMELKNELSSKTLSLKTADNLGVIKEQIEKNLGLLSAAEPYADVLKASLSEGIYGVFLAYLSESDFSDIEKGILSDMMDGSFLQTDQVVQVRTMENLFGFMFSFLEGYDTDILLDYRGLNNENVNSGKYTKKEEEAASWDIGQLVFQNGSDFPEDRVSFDEQLLPSRIYLSDGAVDSGQTDSTHGDLSTGDWFAVQFNKNLDSLMINQYAIEMFSNFARQNDVNAKALNGFRVNDRPMKYETEYIIGGSLNERENVDLVMQYLFSMRTVLNMIHLGIDHDKRLMIMNLAQGIAGWWTGGVGAIVFAVIVAAFWALLESVADVFMLTSGEDVPLIKTSMTWYTALDGNLMELFDGGVRRLENESIQLYEKSKEAITKIVEELNLEITEPMEELIHILASGKQEVIDQEKLAFDEERLKVESFVDQCIYDLMDGHIQDMNDLPRYDGDEYISDVADDMMREIAGEFFLEKEMELVDIIRLKEKVMEDYSESYDSFFLKVMDEAERSYNKVMQIQLEGLKIIVEKAADEKVNLGKKSYHDIADQVKANYLGEVKKPESVDAKIFIPSFTYEGYLMLILSLPIVDEKMKVARMMDLIQMNLQEVYGDNVSLSDYFMGIKTTGSVIVDSKFLPGNLEGNRWELEIENITSSYR